MQLGRVPDRGDEQHRRRRQGEAHRQRAGAPQLAAAGGQHGEAGEQDRRDHAEVLYEAADARGLGDHRRPAAVAVAGGLEGVVALTRAGPP